MLQIASNGKQPIGVADYHPHPASANQSTMLPAAQDAADRVQGRACHVRDILARYWECTLRRD